MADRVTTRPVANLAHYHDVFLNGEYRGMIYRHRSLWCVELRGGPGGWEAQRFRSFREAREFARTTIGEGER